MKKLILALAIVLCASSVSAQNVKQTIQSIQNFTRQQTWGIGARLGSGFQLDVESGSRSQNYFEGRFGMSWCNSGATLMADLTLLYNWHLATMDWTPDAGQWYFDMGCGAAIGGRDHYAYFGFAGSAKLGIKFRDTPIKLALDWTPYIGPGISYGVKTPVYKDVTDANTGETVQAIVDYKKTSHASFNEYGLLNFGISAIYYF